MNSYREKVVDLELDFHPPIKGLVDSYLEEKSIDDDVSRILESADATNIRIIFKINLYLKLFKTTAQTIGIELEQDELIKATKIICLRFLSDEPISLEMAKSGFFGLSLSKEKNEKESKLEKLTRKLGMFPPYPLDGMVYELVQNGYCADETIKKYQSNYFDNQARNKANEDFKTAYAKWGNNFIAPIEDVFSDMRTLMNAYSGKMTNEQFVANLHFLESLGYTEDTEAWKKRQLELIDRCKGRDEKRGLAKALLPSKAAEQYIKLLEQDRRPPSNPTAIINRVVKDQSWHPDDYEEMNLMSEQQVFDWISTSTEERFIELIKKIREIWSGSEAPSAVEFCEKLNTALAKIAARSPLDKARVKVFLGMQ